MIVDNYLTLKTSELSKGEWSRLLKKLHYRDADGNEWECYRPMPSKGAVRLPRGAWNLIPDKVGYTDKRVSPETREFDFKRELDATLPDGRVYEGQKDAVKAMLEHHQGLVICQPGFGKTNVALAFLAVCGMKSLVLVHTEDILQQWLGEIKEAIPDAVVGVIRADEESVGDITVATIQTFHKRLNLNPKKWKHMFGAVILDEAHHASAKTFEQVLNQMAAFYRFGLTATEKRADGKHPYMKFVIGPVIYRRKFEAKVPVKVIPVKTGFYAPFRGTWDWSNLLRSLVRDEDRTEKIARVAVRQIQKGHTTLVLSRQIEHLVNIEDHMRLQFGFDEGWTQQVEILTGVKSRAERLRILAAFRAGEIKCLLATQLADEALDVPILSRVLLTFPGKHDGRIIQQIGRALREHPEKDNAIVFDFYDHRVRPLRRQWLQRKQTYKRLGIKVKRGRKLRA